MWAYRRMLKISWMERKINSSILAVLNVETRLAVVCKQRILRFFGHIIKRDGSSLEKLIIEGKIEGKRSRGRTPMRWIDQIKTVTGYPLEEAIRSGENRELWKEIVANVNWSTDGSPNFRFWKMDLRRKNLVLALFCRFSIVGVLIISVNSSGN